jgi:hypothetical protein
MMYEHGEEYDEHLVAALKQLYDARGDEITCLNVLLAAYREVMHKSFFVFGGGLFRTWTLSDADLDAAVLAAAEPHDPH